MAKKTDGRWNIWHAFLWWTGIGVVQLTISYFSNPATVNEYLALGPTRPGMVFGYLFGRTFGLGVIAASVAALQNLIVTAVKRKIQNAPTD